MPSTQNVATGKPQLGGAIFRAPVGTPLPTSIDDERDSAFVELGFVSEDGVTSSNSRESEEIKAWGGTTVLTPQTSYGDTWQAVFIESKNINVLKMVYGDGNVSGSLADGITVKANSQELPFASYIFDMVLNGAKKRVVLPNASISEVGDTTYVDNDVIGYDVTLAALPDENENTHYEYIKADASPTQYTVTFSTDGGSAVASQTVVSGGKVTKPADPTKSGSTFDGWYKEAGLTTEWDFDNDTVTADTTLYAKWS